MAHTPGPWQVVPPERAMHYWVVGDSDCGSIADCSPPGPWMSFEEAAANARLCAAAPDLLATLKLILPLAKGYAPEGQSKQARSTCNDWIAAAVAAVERAEGQS